MEIEFRVEAVGPDTFNVWVEGANSAVADGRVQRNERRPGYWDALVSGGREPAVIKTGKSRGGSLMAVLEHFTRT